MTSPVVQVLVGPLRPDGRRADLLARLELLPAPQRAVLRGSYLEGREVAELAEQCRLTVRELALVRSDALRALGRTRPARAGARPAPAVYS